MHAVSAHPWLTALALCFVLAPFVVRALRRASQHADAIRWDFQRSTRAPATDATASKETHTA